MGSSNLPLSAKNVVVSAMPSAWPVTAQLPEHFLRLRVNDVATRLQDGPDEDNPAADGGRQDTKFEHTFADCDHFAEILDQSVAARSHQASLVKVYEARQNNAVTLLRQQLDILNLEILEAEQRQLQILEENSFELQDGNCESLLGEEGESPPAYDGYLGDDGPRSWSSVPGSDCCSSSEVDGDPGADFWRDRARALTKLLAESIRREKLLMQKLNKYTSCPPAAEPFDEIYEQVKKLDEYLRFALRRAPIVVGHQDSDLRYRFLYNAFPTLTEEEVIGKTDNDIYKGLGVAELVEFKREVLRKGFAEKREITFNTDLFGEKTFLVAVEPVIGRDGEAMGLNYIAMDVSEQVDKRERLARIREQVAVQKAMETELHKTIHITEETMRAKQMLATMSHEIRSPLSGVVSMAEVLATTNLDTEQRQLVDVMVSSGDLVLQLINDILDFSKVQSGAMKFEAKKFRPREVVKHVLQMALASMQNKNLILEARVYDDVPVDIIGDVLRIRQVFTNLVSNAIKFTHEGSVTINVKVTEAPKPIEGATQNASFDSDDAAAILHPEISAESDPCILRSNSLPLFPLDDHQVLGSSGDGNEGVTELSTQQSAVPIAQEDLDSDCLGLLDEVWLHCEICDTGIGIPEAALPLLFERYTQVSTTHARKYGGTGLGLAICKNLVELMGGMLTVASEVNVGSIFSFKLPLRVGRERSLSSGHLSEEVYDMMTDEAKQAGIAEKLASTKKVGYVHFTSKVNNSDIPSESGQPGLSSRSSSTLMANSLTCSTAESSRSEQKPSKGIVPHLTHPRALGPKDVVNVAKASDNMGSKRQTLRPTALRRTQERPVLHNLVKPQSLRGGGPSKKSGKSLDRALSHHLLPGALSPLNNREPQRVSRILLAEDNKVNVMVAQSMLKRLGHNKLDVVSNGAEALKALQKNTYDIILMDVCMPVMDGLEATRRIRKYEETGSWEIAEGEEGNKGAIVNSNDSPPDVRFASIPPSQSPIRQRVPILAMTANALADNMLECYTHGMDSFIAKPITFTKLEEALKQYLPCLGQPGSLRNQQPVEDPKTVVHTTERLAHKE